MQSFKEDQQTDWLDAIHEAGFGRSAIQRALVSVLAGSQVPLSADEIWEQVRQIRPETGRATVFRHVDKLISAGLLHRVHGFRQCSTYTPALAGNHVLLVCTVCGQVSHVNLTERGRLAEAMAALQAVAHDTEVHHVTGYHVQLLGICNACQTDESC